jgi:NADH:ubiquinone oxidoreductase subunit
MTTKGIWRSARQALARILLGRRHVGRDRIGNDYFVEGDKRIIDYNSRHPDPRLIPYQWNRWLRRQRHETPTASEIALDERAELEKQQRIDRIRLDEREAESDVVFIKGRPFADLQHLIRAFDDDDKPPPKS